MRSDRLPGRRRSVLAGRSRLLVAALLASALAAACDRPFEPFAENRNGPFSIVGYLDLGADTQWVRVMPVRRNLFAGPEPIDAVVTLERVDGGRTVTLRDSLFEYRDPRLDGVAYARLFWTTERLVPRARYRLRATRSDGAASTAVVDMPDDLEFTYLNLRDTALVEVRAERLLFAETIHLMRTAAGEPAGTGVRRQRLPTRPGIPGVHVLSIDGAPLFQDALVDVRRTELRVAAARSDWPLAAAPSNPALSLPDTMPSNVENGLGFLGGVATWTVPYLRCSALVGRPGGRHSCSITFSRQSGSIAGRVIRQPCGRPHALADVNLTATYADGGAATFRWRTGWDGGYRFEGIEPGADLVLDLGPRYPPLRLPRLAPGQRYAVQDIFVTQDC